MSLSKRQTSRKLHTKEFQDAFCAVIGSSSDICKLCHIFEVVIFSDRNI